MAAIKRFFEKKKLEVKFKKAGDGHKLTDDTRSKPSGIIAGTSGYRRPVHRTEDSRQAGAAALERINQQKKVGNNLGSSMGAIRLQVKKQLDEEKKAQALAQMNSSPHDIVVDHAPVLATTGVMFVCPLIGPEALRKEDMEIRINEFLYSQLPEEPEMTSALMIHTLNKDKEKVKTCIDILCKYIDNISNNPGEEKYCRIRVNNKVYQEKVAPLKGTWEFLNAAGFEKKEQQGPNEGPLEEYLVMGPGDLRHADRLQGLKDVLLTAEPIRPELDRGLKVFYPSARGHRIQVPDEFWAISAEEVKREQQLRTEAVEKLGMLRTKEMREREHLRELRRYRYALIRIRFPNGCLLQGTFRATEKCAALKEFVQQQLENDWMPFHLNTQTGHKLDSDDVSIAELGLAPAALINFEWNETIQREIAAQKSSTEDAAYLKDEVMALIESL